MFFKKKKQIERLQRQLREVIKSECGLRKEMVLCEERERSRIAECHELREEHIDDLKIIEDMTRERDHALAMAAEYGKRVEELKKEVGDLVRQIDEAKRAAECPADCKNRKNPPACRTCTRYPHARDKYEVAE